MTNLKKLRILGLGDPSVGKTTFFKKLTDKSDFFSETTIGVDYYSIKTDRYHMMCWDAGGMKEVVNIAKSYIKDKDLYILFFDLSEYGSFLNLRNWIKIVLDHHGSELNENELCEKMLFVGTKDDKLLKFNFKVSDNIFREINRSNFARTTKYKEKSIVDAKELILNKAGKLDLQDDESFQIEKREPKKKRKINFFQRVLCCKGVEISDSN